MHTRMLLLAWWAVAGGAVAEAAPRSTSSAPARPASKPRPKPPPKPAPKVAPRPAPRPPPTQTARPATPSKAPAARPAPRPAAPRVRPPPTSRPPVARPPAGTAPGTWHPPASPGVASRTPSTRLAADVKDAQLSPVVAHRDPAQMRPVGTPPGGGGPPPDVSHSGDPRYTRPGSHTVYVRPAGPRPPSVYVTYGGWYTGYWCHPWYRWMWGTSAVVWFGWTPYPWYDTWIPPVRYGWTWMPGVWVGGWYSPGYWTPVGFAPFGYAYVPGWWEGDAYVEGYYRLADRDGWVWVDGWYTEDGDYVRGHWEPDDVAPDGYVWEAGFWDGNEYHDGFWRPELLDGYRWLSAYYDEGGVYRAGYWAPIEDRPGHQWVPGWFDGTEWVPGYWITDEEAAKEDVAGWKPPEGATEGWEGAPEPGDGEEPPEATIVKKRTARDGEKPVAVPVVTPREGQR